MVDHADLTPKNRFGLVKPHVGKASKITIVGEQYVDAAGIVKEAFRAWGRHYRETLPELYVKVDEELAKPERPKQHPLWIDVNFEEPFKECLRCGEIYPLRLFNGSRFCSEECHDEHKEWCFRTGRKMNGTGFMKKPRPKKLLRKAKNERTKALKKQSSPFPTSDSKTTGTAGF